MNMNIFRLSVVAALVLMAGCAQKAGTSTGAAAAPKPVATVNGTPLTSAQFELFTKAVSGKTSAELTPAQRTQALDTLVRAEAVAQQAEKEGLDKQGDAPPSLALARLQILEQAAMTNFLKDHKATDAELKAEYDSQVAAMPKTQYKARHILVKTKDEADQIIAQLKKGAKFEKLAADHSLDGSKNNGGDLGWFSPANMVKPFADAVAGLKKGETTQTPVQTEFGWHVIRLDDTRETTPPAFDAVKDRLVQIVEAKKFKAYGDGLVSVDKVEKNL
jgi:peptidyl-prolyl cis-trans isomerase C